MHNSRDGVAVCGGVKLTLRHLFRINRALVEHIVDHLVRRVVMLRSADHLIRLSTPRWITNVIRQVTCSLDNCFVRAAPRRVKLNRIGFTAVGGNEGLKFSVVGVVVANGLEGL